MKAMIFAAGLGTRFKPWTDSHPKALAVVNGKTLLQRNVEYLRSFGINDIIINVHHFAGQIRNAILENKGWGANVLISDEEDEVLETGGGLLKAIPLTGNETLVTVNVDILTDLDLSALISAHEEKKALITLAITKRKTSRYLLFDDEGALCGWRNSSTGEERIAVQKPGLNERAYSGIAVFDPAVFAQIPFTGKFSLIDLYLHLASSQRIFAFDHTGGKLVDVGKPESVTIAEKVFR
jgi:N-acetyl-alpha-D-muramate 1-phosphate uridylyltransferase